MLRLTYNNERKEFSTGLAVDPEKWDSSKYKVKGKTEDATQTNKYIDEVKGKILSLFKDMLLDENVSLGLLVDKFLGRDEGNMSLLELIQYHNDNFESRIGTDFSLSTFKKYRVTFSRIKEFVQHSFSKPDLKLKELSYKFMADFEHFLKTVHHNDHNTAIKHCKNLKKIINMALLNGWIKSNPFTAFKCSYKDVDRVYLTQQELEQIENKTFSSRKLQITRDIFLFQCYTGLAFADMAKLRQEDISMGIDGGRWIITRRKKTDVRSAIPLLPKALALLDKYNAGADKPILPFYSIQKFNSYLHEIADVCGINKNITSHVGRRTFATTIALANGVSLESISKILGHTSTKITHQYAMVTDMKVSQDMQELKEKLSNNLKTASNE